MTLEEAIDLVGKLEATREKDAVSRNADGDEETFKQYRISALGRSVTSNNPDQGLQAIVAMVKAGKAQEITELEAKLAELKGTK